MSQILPSNHDSRTTSICILGLGLIGGSFALALKKAGHQGRISGFARSPRTAEQALKLGVVDAASLDLSEAVEGAQVIMLAVPMLTMREQMLALEKIIAPTVIVTDAGSVKQPFVEDARAIFGSLKRVVPGHPIAGLEKSGIDAVQASLFEQRRVLLTPTAETDESAINLVSELWQATGAMVENLSPEHHDRVLAATSHLPHVLAFALVDMLAKQQESEEIFRYAAGGFRDFSRIASGDTIMWRDICLTNQEPISDAIDGLSKQLELLKTAIDTADADTIEAVFKRAKTSRDKHVIK